MGEAHMSKILDERDFAHVGNKAASLRVEDIAASLEFRRMYETLPNVVSAEDMPWERSPDGLIKHLVHHKMNTRERCVEGAGYDLHWDLKFDCLDAFEWQWADEPKKFAWERGDFIYVPPFTIHQHFNDDATSEARLIVISNRMVKEMGFDWFDQIENAPGY